MPAGHGNLTLDGCFEAGCPNLDSWDEEDPHTEQAPALGETAGTVPTGTERYHSSTETLQGRNRPWEPSTWSAGKMSDDSNKNDINFWIKRKS